MALKELGVMGPDALAERMVRTAADIATSVRRDRTATPFDSIYATYRPLLKTIAIRKFGIAPSDADDLVQDVFATYVVKQNNVRDLHPYLIGAICNAARQARRRDAIAPFCDRTPCAATPTEEVVDGVIRKLAIGATLARLGTSCREVLERFYLRGDSAAAIARSRETSANYIARLLSYCRTRAREIYGSMDRAK